MSLLGIHMIRTIIKMVLYSLISGLLIFSSSLIAGATLWAAFVGAIYAKIGTTILYYVYETTFEYLWKCKEKP